MKIKVVKDVGSTADLGPIAWLCLPPNSELTITIPCLRANAEFLCYIASCNSRMLIPSNLDYARAEAEIRR